MWIFTFYRLYCALVVGSLSYFLFVHSLWCVAGVAVLARTVWHLVERVVRKKRIAAWFDEHEGAFKEQFGPYGIRIINRAETDPAVKSSLAEVFTPHRAALRRNVDNLEAMDAIFKAGMRPDAETWQLHDLKLQYGKFRLEKSDQ